MTSQLAAPVAGAQQPRLCSLPPFASSSGVEAVELCRMAGLMLDPWEEFVLASSLNERADGRWAAFEVGVCVSRQNGKGAIIEGRELTGLFLLGERMLTHSAHLFDTSLEAFRRLLFLIENTPEFDQRVKRVSRSHGEEGIELKGGQRIRFRTRTKGGGRGFSGDFVALDEAMFLPVSTVGALMPTLSARSVHGNPQLWYTGSAVDQFVHDDGVVFARIRERGTKGDDPSLMYVEWSHEADNPDAVVDDVAADPAVWAQANPGLGIRISAEHVANERRSMDHRTFCVERLGVGDWPAGDGSQQAVIELADWEALSDPKSSPEDPVVFALDVKPDRSAAAIAVAGKRSDGLRHVEIIDHRSGMGWVVKRLVELTGRHEHAAVICDGVGPAGSLIPQLEAAGIEVEAIGTREYGQACGRFLDAVGEAALRHLGTAELAAAIRGATKRPLGDAWAWSRKGSAADISPLVASTLALWRAEKEEVSPWERRAAAGESALL